MKSVFAATAVVASAVDLVSFSDPAANFDALIDPVMGGQSVATATIVDGAAVLDGEVKIVPALNAPGFITGQSDMKVDASALADGGELVMKVRSSTPDYTGFKVSFAAKTLNPTLACATGGSTAFGRGCFKSPFTVPAGDDFTEIRIPLSEFSDKWDSATGELTTLCKDDASVCPSADRLGKVQRVSLWGEGAAGKVHIEVQSVAIEAAQHLQANAGGQLVTFDGADGTTFTFKELNDPVMGGKSTGTWSLGDGFGTIDGEVVDVPSLSAPGFIKAQAKGNFPDVSAFADGSLVLSVRTPNPEYEGYRVTFVSGAASPDFSCSAGGSLPFSRGCYKAKFSVPAGDDFVDVKIPFNMFSDKWSSATGEQTTTCADDADVCPTASKLANIKMLEFWGEGASGKVHLDVQSVSAESASGDRFVLV